jgi:ATPase subunit of ABC transporter with duplicated ATPase domains
MAREFIYHMRGLTKTYPGNRKVLQDVHLSFYPDAKIGVLGVNGSGKSTLLRIMAGLDTEWSGEGWVAEGARVGYLPQEPQLDEGKTVRENVMEGVAASQAILDRYNELAMNYSDETADEMTSLQDEIEAKGCGISIRRWIRPWTRCAARLMTGRSTGCRAASGAASPCASSCSSSPSCCSSTSRPTTSTPRRRPGSKGICAATRARS